LLVTAYRAAGIASDETARYLVAFIYGIIALSVAIVFTQLYHPWIYIWAYIGLTMRIAVTAMQTVPANARAEKRSAVAAGSYPAGARRARSRVPATHCSDSDGRIL